MAMNAGWLSNRHEIAKRNHLMISPVYTQCDAASLEAAVEVLLKQGARALLALLPEAEQDQLPALQSLCLRRGLELAGGIFPQLIRGGQLCAEGCWLLPRKQTTGAELLGLSADLSAETAACMVATRVETLLQGWDPAQGRPTLFLALDAVLPNMASMVDELYLRLADQVSYFGVNAGSETFQPIACLFDQHRTLGHGALALLLPSSAEPVIQHGYPLPDHVMSATATEGNRIFQIDWRPAFEVYQEQVRQQYGQNLNRDNFYQYGVHFPLGIALANNELLVRIPVALEDDGSVLCVGEVPENSLLFMLQAPALDQQSCVSDIAARLPEPGGDDETLLTFYCAGRRMHYGAEAGTELARLGSASGGRSMAGALTLGEIGSLRAGGYPMFHNAAIACALWKTT